MEHFCNQFIINQLISECKATAQQNATNFVPRTLFWEQNRLFLHKVRPLKTCHILPY